MARPRPARAQRRTVRLQLQQYIRITRQVSTEAPELTETFDRLVEDAILGLPREEKIRPLTRDEEASNEGD